MAPDDQPPDSFPADLKRQWLAGRAEQIFDQMREPLTKWATESATERAEQIFKALGQAPRVPGVSTEQELSTHLMMAWSQAIAEGVLLSVALQLAHEESRTPPPQH